jgi:hypothetical protein
MKALVILLGYLVENEELDDSVKSDLEDILKLAPYHLEQMLQVSMEMAMAF